MLKKEQLEIRAIEKEQLLIERTEEEIIDKIEAKDDEVVKAVKEMKKMGVKVLRNKKQQIENELVLKEGKVYCYKLKSLGLDRRKNLVQSLHKGTQQRTLYRICLLYILKHLVCAKSFQPTINYHVCASRPTCVIHIV